MHVKVTAMKRSSNLGELNAWRDNRGAIEYLGALGAATRLPMVPTTARISSLIRKESSRPWI